MSGWLLRKSRTRWKRLWFVLKEQVLYVYRASEDVVASESIPVLGYSVEPMPEVQHTPRGFSLISSMFSISCCSLLSIYAKLLYCTHLFTKLLSSYIYFSSETVHIKWLSDLKRNVTNNICIQRLFIIVIAALILSSKIIFFINVILNKRNVFNLVWQSCGLPTCVDKPQTALQKYPTL